jgi:hypothetical protein
MVYQARLSEFLDQYARVRKGVYFLVWHNYRRCLAKSSAGLDSTIFAWLTSRLDLVLVVLKQMNVGDVVLPGLVKLD